MQIQFKQNEIEAAIRGYINKQGISLKERKVSIVFTAGRGGNGLSAEATIEEFLMPEEEEILGEPMIEPMDEPKAIPIGPIKRSINLVPAQLEELKPVPEVPVVDNTVDNNIPVPYFGTPEKILTNPEPPNKAPANLFG